MNRRLSWLMLASMVFAAVGQATPACDELNGSRPERLLEYLQSERELLKPACAQHAMTQIGVQNYTPAINVLLRNLDDRLPDEFWKKPGGVVLHPSWIGAIYPALDGLFLIGKPAIPGIITAIGDTDTSDMIRDHAIELLLAILSADVSEAITLLMRAGLAVQDTSTSQRLTDAAKTAAAKCIPRSRSACINALYAQ